MIHVIAQIELTPGCRDAFLAEFSQIVAKVQAEAGCIEYGAAVDAVSNLERQHCDPNRVMIIEKWETLRHLEDHLIASHMLEYRQRVSEMVSTAQLNILEAA